MSKKSKQTQTTKIDHKYMTRPETQADRDLDAELAKGEQSDPSIQYRAANRKNSLRNMLGNPFGADYSHETAEAIKYHGENEIDQQAGQEYAMDDFRKKQSRWAKLFARAQARAPQLVSSGGTTTSVMQQPMFDWGGMITGAAMSMI